MNGKFCGYGKLSFKLWPGWIPQPLFYMDTIIIWNMIKIYRNRLHITHAYIAFAADQFHWSCEGKVITTKLIEKYTMVIEAVSPKYHR